VQAFAPHRVNLLAEQNPEETYQRDDRRPW